MLRRARPLRCEQKRTETFQAFRKKNENKVCRYKNALRNSKIELNGMTRLKTEINFSKLVDNE